MRGILGARTRAELRLLAAAKSGREADVSVWDRPRSRTVRGSFLAALCLSAEGRIRDVLTLKGARVVGPVQLGNQQIRLLLRFVNCVFEDEVDLSDARLKQAIEFDGGEVERITADRLRADSDIRFTGVAIANGVSLASAHVLGSIDMRGAVLSSHSGPCLDATRLVLAGELTLDEASCANGEVCLQWAAVREIQAGGASIDNPGGHAIRADAVHVKSGVYLDSGFHAKGEVRFVGAVVGGEVACTAGTFETPTGIAFNGERMQAEHVYLDRGFEAHGQVRLVGAKLGHQLNCSRGFFDGSRADYALDADGLVCRGDVFLNDGFTALGAVRMHGLEVDGDLNCTHGAFRGMGGTALDADGMTTPGTVFLDAGFRAEGQVRLARATIGRQLVCSGGSFSSEDRAGEGLALDFSGLVCHGDVLLSAASGTAFRAVGEVRARGAHIERDLDFDGAELMGSRVSLDARGLRAMGRMHWKPMSPPRGEVDLTVAHVGRLHDHSISDWPAGKYSLAEFTYDTIAAPPDADDRKQWLKATESFSPQSYRKLEEVYTASGATSDARQIAMAGAGDSRAFANATRISRLWNWFLGFSVGYGFKLYRPLILLLVLAVANYFIYRWAAGSSLLQATNGADLKTDPCPKGYPCFAPEAYAVQLLVPVLDLGQVRSWVPRTDGGTGHLLAIWTWSMIGIGWLAGVALIAGLNRILRRD